MEHFTDGGLITRALQGDREAIKDVCGVIVNITNQKFLNTNFWRGLESIRCGNTPNEGFRWISHRKSRGALRNEARAILEVITANIVQNDEHLFYYITTVLKALTWCSPDEAFKWTQLRKGRRVANVNVFRDWDIKMSVFNLMVEGYGFTTACEIVGEAGHFGHKLVLQIAAGITADSAPDLPDNLFPLPKKLGIKRESLDAVKVKYKRPKYRH